MNGRALLNLLSDRPVAYHPDIARIVGGVKAAVFLCQLLYWTGKGKRQDGYIWKVQAEWEEETALTRYEQEGARKKLKELGVLKEKLRGIPAKLHYKVNTDRLLELIDNFYNKPTDKIAEDPQTKIVENPQTITESTQENTSHDADAPLADSSPPEQEPSGEAALNAAFGPRKTPKAEAVVSTGDWRARIRDAPYLTWGDESAELTRQKLQYGTRAESVLKLGYELDRALGLRPIWEVPSKVKTWTSGLYACLLAAEWDTDLVLATARKMREDKLTIKSPWSIEGMVEAAAAEKRSGGGRIAIR